MILEGSGTVELWPSPEAALRMERETHEIRAGDVISRPPSTGISHFLRAGEVAMTFLAYGTREPNDVCYYPRSNKIYWRGLGLIARLEPLDYDDGEPEDYAVFRRTQPNWVTTTQPCYTVRARPRLYPSSPSFGYPAS